MPSRFGMLRLVGFGGRMRSWPILAAVFLPLVAGAQPTPTPPSPPPPPPIPAAVRPAAPDRTTQQQLDLPDRSLPFRAIVSTHRLSAGTTPEADIVTTAFLLDNVPLTGRPVWTKLVASACSMPSVWLTVRTAVTCSASRAVRARCSV